MRNKVSLLVALAVSLGALTSAQEPQPPPRRGARGGRARGHWPEARGPSRDGTSKETGLVEKWALNGENFLWRAPYGGRPAPAGMGHRGPVHNHTHPRREAHAG